MPVKDVKKVVLAYSGGLDTSVILRWLQTTYGCEVVTFTADLGQGETRILDEDVMRPGLAGARIDDGGGAVLLQHNITLD